MKINFRLKDQSKVSSYLFADILISNIRVKYSLKLSVKTSFFDENKQRLKGNSEESNQINLLLSKYENDISRVLRDIQYQGTLTADSVRNELNRIFRKVETKPEVIPDFTDYIMTIINNAVATKKPRTIKSYNTTLNKLLAYEQRNKLKLSFESIDYSFYSLFVIYAKNSCYWLQILWEGTLKILKYL